MTVLYSIYDLLKPGPEIRPYYIGTIEDTDESEIVCPHRHDYYSIIYFLEGNGINVIDFEEHEIKANRIFMMSPGQIHNWSYSNNTKGFILLLDKYFYHFKHNKIPYIDVPEEYMTLILSYYNYLINEYQKKDLQTEESIYSGLAFLNSITSRIIKEQNYVASIVPPEIVIFVEMIRENINENLPIQTYADYINVTADKLNETCKSHLGLTAKQIILDQKITEAKRQLYFSNLSIKEIAYKMGFEDSSYFSRIFKEKTNTTPKMFREKVLK